MDQEQVNTTTGRFAGFLEKVTRLVVRYVWLWPLCGVFIVIIVGVWVRDGVERAMKNELAAQLQTILNAEVSALRIWFKAKELDAKSVTGDVRVAATVGQLAELAAKNGSTAEDLLNSPAAKELKRTLLPMLEPADYTDYVVVAKRDRRVLASLHEHLVGQDAPTIYDEFLPRVFRGQLATTRPFPGEVLLPDVKGNLRSGVPTMMVAVPVKASDGEVIAALALRMKPEREFSPLFSVGYMGESGESYAFDKSGVMLTGGRFESELKSLGLLPDRDEADPVLALRLRDPGMDLRSGERPARRRTELGLTFMASEATRGRTGFDTHGYRDYRGVPVVGAWTWLPDYRMGIATEMSVEEAYEPLYILRRAFLAMFLLLCLATILIFGFTLTVRHLRATARKEALSGKRLGQYALLQDIGSGGNGRVFKARHAMLRRPVAIKLLDPERTDENTLARFEQEVQVTSQLTHPNTVAIYDYGRTPEGLFYYAMEFLDGFNLGSLVKQFGPQSEGRTIYILRQVCGSLAEAHDVGLIHRDIKPANILLTRRGGLCDISKVLDFGVAKAINKKWQWHLTATDNILGTPSFVSPEAIEAREEIDARSDLYSLGAVGYFLLTGKLLFDVESLKSWLDSQVHTMPLRPSERLGRPIARDLEDIIMQCLAKDRNQRPPSARALNDALGQCASSATWGPQQAAEWWQANWKGADNLASVWQQGGTLHIHPGPEMFRRLKHP